MVQLVLCLDCKPWRLNPGGLWASPSNPKVIYALALTLTSTVIHTWRQLTEAKSQNDMLMLHCKNSTQVLLVCATFLLKECMQK